jgi:5-formyltetrahydrofolate cyclo-ligase
MNVYEPKALTVDSPAKKGSQVMKLDCLELVVPIVGFELTTYRLQGGCSTN